MKLFNIIIVIFLAILMGGAARKNTENHISRKAVSYVNPFIGTDGHGHTFPGATLPFGMVQLSPDTGIEGWDWCSGYHYSDNSIMGFSHTHLSGTGRGDLLDILFMPTTGEISTEPGSKSNPNSGYRSRFDHSRETASPGYYAVMLDDYNINVELTASKRVGFHRYTFPESDNHNVLIDLFHGRKGDSVITTQINIVNDTLITGYRKSRGWGEPGEEYWVEQEVYFAAAFSIPFEKSATVLDTVINEGIKTQVGTKVKAYVTFDSNKGKEVLVKVGISAVDIIGAIKNMQAEIPHWSFDQVKKEAETTWERHLQSITVEGEENKKEIFYTALYHAQIAPYLFSDVDKRYLGTDKRIRSTDGFDNYTVFSL